MQKQSHRKLYPKNRKPRALISYKCNICGKEVLSRSNIRKYCDSCKLIAKKKTQKEWWLKHHKENFKKQRYNALKRLYGITLNDYDRLFEEQNKVCKICGKVNTDGKRLSIDHDHVTGKIRGLLCNLCNLKLGWFENNKNNVLKYLGE